MATSARLALTAVAVKQKGASLKLSSTRAGLALHERINKISTVHNHTYMIVLYMYMYTVYVNLFFVFFSFFLQKAFSSSTHDIRYWLWAISSLPCIYREVKILTKNKPTYVSRAVPIFPETDAGANHNRLCCRKNSKELLHDCSTMYIVLTILHCMTEDGIRYVYGLCCFHDFALCSSNLVPMIGSRDRDDSLIYSEDQRASIVL